MLAKSEHRVDVTPGPGSGADELVAAAATAALAVFLPLPPVWKTFMMQEAAVEAAHVLFRRSYARGCRGVIGVRDWRCR